MRNAYYLQDAVHSVQLIYVARLYGVLPCSAYPCGDQSFSFRTKRGYNVNSQAYQFVIVAVFNREHDSAAKPQQQKTLIYFARPTKTAMLRRLLLRRLRKPLRYSQISPIFKQVNGYTVIKYCRHPHLYTN